MQTKRYDDGDTFEYKGRTFKVFLRDDDDCGPPWEESDGHGPVSDWTSNAKRPGQWELNSDNGQRRYYDAQAANQLAKKDGWGLSDDDKLMLINLLAETRIIRRPKKGAKPMVKQRGFIHQTFSYTNDQFETVTIPGRQRTKPLTAGEIRAEAVRRDFEYLRGWCNDDWRYIGVSVVHVPNGSDGKDLTDSLDYTLWGISSDDDSYIMEVAHQLADDATRAIEREVATLKDDLAMRRRLRNQLRRELRQLPEGFPNAVEAAKDTIKELRERVLKTVERMRECKGS